uniref:Uncharacterized protein n=1 Tax=Glossina pallidipes TaxID=7398 RepID=A0A1A9Z4X8_GLOPL
MNSKFNNDSKLLPVGSNHIRKIERSPRYSAEAVVCNGNSSAALCMSASMRNQGTGKLPFGFSSFITNVRLEFFSSTRRVKDVIVATNVAASKRGGGLIKPQRESTQCLHMGKEYHELKHEILCELAKVAAKLVFIILRKYFTHVSHKFFINVLPEQEEVTGESRQPIA